MAPHTSLLKGVPLCVDKADNAEVETTYFIIKNKKLTGVCRPVFPVFPVKIWLTFQRKQWFPRVHFYTDEFTSDGFFE